VLHRALQPDTSGRGWTYLPFEGPPADVAATADFIKTLYSLGWIPFFLQSTDADVTPSARSLAVGISCYLRPDPGNGTVEIGSILFAPALQRSRAATEAMYLLARHVFADLGYRRYEWKCDALNAASVAAANRLGFTYEGTWRNAVVYKGRNRDTAWFAITDEDWQHLSPAFEAWLDPANFQDGRQRTSLTARRRSTDADSQAPALAARRPGGT
jgi:RimJ/RimL family protein N-acetyltransferase